MTELAALLALVFFINIVLKWILLKLHERFRSQGKPWKDSLVVALITPLTSFVWLIAALQALNMGWERFSEHPLIASPHALMHIGLILAVAWFLLRWKKAIVTELKKPGATRLIDVDRVKIDPIDKVLSLAIYLISALLLLEQTGSSMHTLIAFGGVSGLAIAFASQQIIANFFGGVMIYLTHPFIVGDWIQLPDKDVEGHVEEIGWYTTRVRSFDKRPLYVPNSLLTNALVVNPSRMSHRQFKEVIGLRFQDIGQLPSITKDLEQSLLTHPQVDQSQPPQVHFGAFGPHGVEIHLSAYTTIVDKYAYADFAQDLLYRIASIVYQHGADFSSPVTAVEFPKGIPWTPPKDTA